MVYEGLLITIIAISLGAMIYSFYNSNRDEAPSSSSSGLSPSTIIYLRKQKYTSVFCVAGVQYYDYHIAARKRLFRDEIPIILKRQPKNRKDTNAIEVYFQDIKVGYVPAYEASKLAPQFDRGDVFTAYLESYTSRGHHDDRIEIELINETLKEQIEGV